MTSEICYKHERESSIRGGNYGELESACSIQTAAQLLVGMYLKDQKII
jgi:hypothetical protein